MSTVINMGDIEKEDFKTEILNDFVKKWKPVVVAFFGTVLFAITTTWWVAHNIATTSDIQKVSGIDTLNNSFNALNNSFNNHVQMGNITKIQLIKSKDSLANVTANIEKRLNIRYVNVTQRKDKYGNIIYRSVN